MALLGELRIYENLDELKSDLADYIAELSEAAVKERGAFAIALSGGSLIGLTGVSLLKGTLLLLKKKGKSVIRSKSKLDFLLKFGINLKIIHELWFNETVKAPYKKTIGWSKWHIFWADELYPMIFWYSLMDSLVLVVPRFVLCFHLKFFVSVFTYVNSMNVPIVPSHLHSINDSVSAEEAADEYIVSDISDCPKLDLILLGIGPDHHVASLCSNHSALNETDKWVTFIIDSPKPPPERITFTFPSLPAQLVQPTIGKLIWFSDKPATSKLKCV
ncbi:hypothetical protein V6Z11_D04G226700 [Gossypium hirsutum]